MLSSLFKVFKLSLRSLQKFPKFPDKRFMSKAYKNIVSRMMYVYDTGTRWFKEELPDFLDIINFHSKTPISHSRVHFPNT